MLKTFRLILWHCVVVGMAMRTSNAVAASGVQLAGSTLYPRLLRIAHGPPHAIGHILASTTGHIFESDDDGKTFRLLSKPSPIKGSEERCCATLFEVPRDVGSLKAGTLLYSASDYTDGVPSMEVYASSDEGSTWTFHSVIKRGGDKKHGLWEPQFSVTQGGALAVFWSDETDPCCSQKLAQKRSLDGRTWTDEQNTVRTTVFQDRPGMVTVAQLPSGIYFMTYEVCGHYQCAVFSRTSEDGWNYGDPADLHQVIRTAEGKYFEHAPQVTWVPDGGGSLLLIGQMLYNNDGTIDALHNGHVIFRNNSAEGRGAWTMMNAVIDVSRSFDNYCPNYSSALLAVDGDLSLLKFASDYDEMHRCTTFYASKAFQALSISEPPAAH